MVSTEYHDSSSFFTHYAPHHLGDSSFTVKIQNAENTNDLRRVIKKLAENTFQGVEACDIALCKC